MRILVLGNLLFAGELAELGHDLRVVAQGPQMKTTIFGPGVHHGPFVERTDVVVSRIPISIFEILQALDGWRPDWVLLGDGSTFPLFTELEKLPVPVVWYAMDAHIHDNWHGDYAAVFDVIFVAQKSYLKNYQCDPFRQSVHWLPLFCNLAYDGPGEDQAVRDIPLAFVGTLDAERNPQRVAFIAKLQEHFPAMVVSTGDYQDLFRRAKLVLNQTVKGDVNFRIFETLACGAVPVTEQSDNGLTTLFTPGTHIALYKRHAIDDAVRVIDQLLKNDSDRSSMAQAGQRLVCAQHSSMHRAKEILTQLESLPLQTMVKLRQQKQVTIARRLFNVYNKAAEVHQFYAAQRDTSSLEGMATRYQALSEFTKQQFML
ncbi:glycosyltransferase family protein [Magnetococcales bacterium HHB-1]